MDETFILILLVILMLAGSYFAGTIPLCMSLSEEKLKNFNIFGAGLLVGTALAVIIPEGIRSLYDDRLPSVSGSEIPGEKGHAHEHENDHSSAIGLSLVLGFVFMMFVDQVSSRRKEGSNERNMTATIGLVVHAAADGVALGAAATTSHKDVEIIVFVAIMLHKAPAAFGLVSFLLHEGIERHRIRKHLGIFSISAPIFTLVTFFGIGSEQKETLNTFNVTAIAMLFSAGTFLYVATVHVLPELTHKQSHDHSYNARDKYDTYDTEKLVPPSVSNGNNGLKNYELAILVCGALMPLSLSLFHHH